MSSVSPTTYHRYFSYLGFDVLFNLDQQERRCPTSVEEEEHFSNRNSSNNGNNGNNDNRQKDIDTFDGFLTDLENRMDTIENRKRLCQQLVDTSPDGEKNSYHTVSPV